MRDGKECRNFAVYEQMRLDVRILLDIGMDGPSMNYQNPQKSMKAQILFVLGHVMCFLQTMLLGKEWQH